MKKKASKNESSDVEKVIRKIKKGDFSGDSGKAVKNSAYTSLTNLVSKIGSLIFVIILARLLMPENFGFYSVALSTILLFVAFSNFGIYKALVVHVSKEISHKRYQKAKSYFLYLVKFKGLLVVIVSLVLLLTARFIAEGYYNKPLYLALLAGVFYIISLAIVGVLKRVFHSTNNFRPVFYQELIYQVFRIVLVTYLVYTFLENGSSIDIVLLWLFVGLSLSIFISAMYLLLKAKNVPFLQEKYISLKNKEKKNLNYFIFAISATAISATIFSSIDIIMLGRFVGGEFIGYYSGAFSILGAIVSLIAFSAALLPVFSGMEKERVKTFFEKSIFIIILISLPVFLFSIAFAPLIITIILGEEFYLSTNLFRLFTILLFVLPVSEIISTYLISINKPIYVTKARVYATIINVFLNYILISTLIQYSEMHAVYGATIATILSNVFYMSFMLVAKSKR